MIKQTSFVEDDEALKKKLRDEIHKKLLRELSAQHRRILASYEPNSKGKLVKKTRSRSSKLARWPRALRLARFELGITGWHIPYKGSELHKTAMAIMDLLPK
jgi:hypothetical protein